MKTSATKPSPAYAGVDIGKAALDLSLAGQPPDCHPNDAAGIAALIKVLKKLPGPVQVICEPRGGKMGSAGKWGKMGSGFKFLYLPTYWSLDDLTEKLKT